MSNGVYSMSRENEIIFDGSPQYARIMTVLYGSQRDLLDELLDCSSNASPPPLKPEEFVRSKKKGAVEFAFRYDYEIC